MNCCHSPTVELPRGLRVLRRLPFPRKLGILERLFGRSLSRQGVQWVETANGIVWKLDLGDAVNRWLLYGEYEGSRFSSWMKGWLADGGLVVDAGANIGQALVYVAPLPRVKVVAFEPLAEAANWLKECLAGYPEWDVQVERKGLSDVNGSLELRKAGPRSTTRTDWYQGRPLETEAIEVVRLDDELARRGVEHVRLWLLNVEGAEWSALRGASRYLADGRIDAIYSRTGAADYPAIRKEMEGLGYGLFVLQGLKLVPAPAAVRAGAINLLILKSR